jgi:hypothetical protein
MAKRELKVKIGADNKDLNRKLDDSKKRVSGFEGAVKKAGIALVGAFAARSAIRGLQEIVKTASNAEETFSKFAVVFQDVASDAEESFKKLRSEYGLSARAAKDLLSNTGDLLTGFGFTGSEALRLSEQVNKLAVDLASFTNYSGGAKGASDALTKALLGERESVKSLGISILEADVQKQVAINTAKGMVFETERQAKAQATLDIAMAQSKNAIGDYSRTSESFANQSRLLKERLEDLATTMGGALLSSSTTMVSKITELVEATDRYFTDVLTKTNMGKLEKFGRILGGSVLGVLTGGQLGRGLSDPVFFEAWAAQAVSAEESINKVRAAMQEISDEDERRAALIDEIANAQKRAASLGVMLEKELGKAKRDQSKQSIAYITAERDAALEAQGVLHDSFEQIIRETGNLIREEAEQSAKLAAEEAARIDAMNAKRREDLGEIGRLREDQAKAEADYIAANTEAARVEALIRQNALAAELDLMEQIAQTRARASGMGIDMDTMPGAAPMIQPAISGGLGQTPDVQADTAIIATLEALNKKLSDSIELQAIYGQGYDALGVQTAAYESAINSLVENGFGAHDTVVQGLIDKLWELQSTQESVKSSMIDWEQIATGAAASIGMSFMQMAQDGSKSVSEIIKQTLAQVTAQLISQIVATIPFPANIALAAGAGTIAGGLISKIPAFSGGGMVRSPTLAMFGEYPGARLNPEYALREDQLKSIAGGGGTLTTRVSGQDLLFILNEAQRRNIGNF